MSVKNPVRIFILLAFGISYIAGIIWAFLWNPIETSMDWGNQPISQLMLKFGPSIAGLIVCRIYYGHEKVIALLKSGIHVKVPWKVIFICLLVPTIGMITSIYIWNPEMIQQVLSGTMLSTILPTLVLKVLLGGGFGEEFGWRGFMQPVLQTKYSWIKTSIIVACFWILWHLPSITLGGQIGNPIIFIVILTGYSIILAWIYNASGGSVFWTAIFHGLANAVSNTLDEEIGAQLKTLESNINTTYAILMVVVAIGLIFLYPIARLDNKAPSYSRVDGPANGR